MTNIIFSRKSLLLFASASLISILFWITLTYPQLAFVNTSFGKKDAIKVAENYLSENYPEYKNYDNAVIFGIDNKTDRYLQKTLGFRKMRAFLEKHDFDLFFWLVRIFKENEKEEFLFSISSKTGQIISFKHTFDENAKRPFITKTEAENNIIAFLQKNFRFDPSAYEIKTDITHKFDHRTEYLYSWRKIGVDIPWSDQKDGGTGKLTTGANITGGEIRFFSKNTFIVPDGFKRELSRIKNVGRYLITVVRLLFYILLTLAVFFIYIRRDHLAMHQSKKFYIRLTIFLIVLLFLGLFNEYQVDLFNFPTTEAFKPYMLRLMTNDMISIVFMSMIVLMPSLAGELLHHENGGGDKRGSSFLYYIQTTFLSRRVFESIILGYFTCIIMLGLQSILVSLGQKYLGVWTEYSWINRVPSAVVPFLVAFTIGFRASFSEEIMYRFYAINLGKKLFNNTVLAVIISSVIWGFSHSSYPVYPTWFRGIEISCIGFFLSWVYLSFGIIPVITAHYLFNAFWHSSGYLLGTSEPMQYFSSLFVLLIPLIFAVVAFFINKEEIIKPLRWRLNEHQLFNLNVLSSYLENNRNHFEPLSNEDIRKELISHHWDVAVIDCAIENFRNKNDS